VGAETYHVTDFAQTRPLARLSLLFILAAMVLQTAPADGDAERDRLERFSVDSYQAGWLTSDRDSDGRPDYALMIDDRGYRIREAMDFNFDGLMDDFYFYDNDVLQRQEIDSNFDMLIDIWVYLWRGVYVQRWERDTDYDGSVDMIRDYDDPQR
jgi:hypothetical protein